MKSARIATTLVTVILAASLLLPTSTLAFECSSKLDSCGTALKKEICDKFNWAYRINKAKCEYVRNLFKDICPNQTCFNGMKETFNSCYKSAK